MGSKFFLAAAISLSSFQLAFADNYSYDCGTIPDPYSRGELYHPTQIERELSDEQVEEGEVLNTRFQDDRVFGGTLAKIEDFPGLVHLTFVRRGPHPYRPGVIADFLSMCGGTKIGENVIVTAAHCVADEKHAIKVTYGASDVSSENAGIAWVNKATCHKGYIAQGLENDIALIHIADENDDDDVDMSDLQDIDEALGMDIAEIEKIRARTYLKAAGWGLYENTDVSESPDLSDLREGSILLGAYGPAKIRTTPNRALRAHQQMSICQGDSGGPLYYKDGDDYRITGLVSGTLEPVEGNDPNANCEKAYDADFTNLYGYKSWLQAEGAWNWGE